MKEDLSEIIEIFKFNIECDDTIIKALYDYIESYPFAFPSICDEIMNEIHFKCHKYHDFMYQCIEIMSSLFIFEEYDYTSENFLEKLKELINKLEELLYLIENVICVFEEANCIFKKGTYLLRYIEILEDTIKKTRYSTLCFIDKLKNIYNYNEDLLNKRKIDFNKIKF